ncbi:NRDE family protein [Curvibacter sp. APW13]|uniref:NRDE family protein n=1 Tax=Curvibacter sp. APW13 TaxID=3077236 RepID=UPI0028DDC6D7|nr:NRDE family protein [Curvibacter sp. APW13]MDT8990354.1 NRDE family protein [Curvibacter sp. APW13]
MCILAWHWQPGDPTELLLVANRDEAYARPAQALHLWPGGQVLAGRDLHAGGTWMGVGRTRRFAALTNYRTGQAPRTDVASRGTLVSDFLEGSASASDYLANLAPRSGDFNPFNLLLWDGEALLGLEGRHGRIVTLEPGWGAVSNGDFHTPWPKVKRLLSGLQSAVAGGPCDDEALLQLLADTTEAAPHELPATGVPAAVEQALSSIFIRTPQYGTRASSVLRMAHSSVRFCEQVHAPVQAQVCTRTSLVFDAE